MSDSDIIEGELGSFSEEELANIRGLILGGLTGRMMVIVGELSGKRALIVGVQLTENDTSSFVVPVAVIPDNFDELTCMGEPLYRGDEAIKKLKEIAMSKTIPGPGSDLVQ